MLQARLLRYSHATYNSVIKKLPHTEENISKEMGVHRMNSILTTKHNFRGKSVSAQRHMILRTDVKCTEHGWICGQSRNTIPQCGKILHFLFIINFRQ
jgi:hypothetical protein